MTLTNLALKMAKKHESMPSVPNIKDPAAHGPTLSLIGLEWTSFVMSLSPKKCSRQYLNRNPRVKQTPHYFPSDYSVDYFAKRSRAD
jgi:hypothetical protein